MSRIHRFSEHPRRFLVFHWHEPLLEGNTRAPREEVSVSYNTELPDALMYAINTASRYQGTIYADVGKRDYEFFRSYHVKVPSVVPAAPVPTPA